MRAQSSARTRPEHGRCQMTLGPIDVVVIGFPVNKFTGKVVPEAVSGNKQAKAQAASQQQAAQQQAAQQQAAQQRAQQAAAESQAQLADMQAQLDAVKAQQTPPPPPPAALPAPMSAAPPAGDDLTAQLQQLIDMKASGALDDAEFATAKAKLLAG